MSAQVVNRAMVHAALAGDAAAVRDTVDFMTPIVQARVARSLSRRSETRGRDISQDIADFTQEVFVALFTDDAKALRRWDPERGLSFANFVGLLAQHRVSSLLRKRARIPWAEDLDDFEQQTPLNETVTRRGAESSLASRELLARLLVELESMLSPRGLDLFQRLYVHDQTVEEVCASTHLSPNAVHQWRRRVGQAARQVLERLESAPASATRPNLREGAK
jgi:RNA polymerase sigma factor (sigma-70 family)